MFAISHISCPGIVSLFSGNGLWSTLRILMIASSSPTPPTSIFPTSEAQYAFFCDPLSPFFSSLQSSSPRSSSHSLVDYSQLFRTLRSNGPQILFAILLYIRILADQRYFSYSALSSRFLIEGRDKETLFYLIFIEVFLFCNVAQIHFWWIAY